MAKGEKHNRATITDDVARKIDDMLRCGVTQSRVAVLLGVTPSIVRDLACGRSWAHLTGRSRASLSRRGLK